MNRIDIGIFSFVAAVLGALPAASARAADLTVTITDLRSTSGSVMAALFSSEQAWKDGAKPFAAQAVQAEGSEVTLRFTGLPPGIYALQVMHDENGNGKLDTNIVGMPVEGYGFSNDPSVMRRAHFDEARFEVPAEGRALVIRLR